VLITPHAETLVSSAQPLLPGSGAGAGSGSARDPTAYLTGKMKGKLTSSFIHKNVWNKLKTVFKTA